MYVGMYQLNATKTNYSLVTFKPNDLISTLALCPHRETQMKEASLPMRKLQSRKKLLKKRHKIQALIRNKPMASTTSKTRYSYIYKFQYTMNLGVSIFCIYYIPLQTIVYKICLPLFISIEIYIYQVEPIFWLILCLFGYITG